MTWGTHDYGVAYWGTGLGFEAGATKLLYMVRMGPNFRALADIIDGRHNAIVGILDLSARG